jgi:hypothetical protein
MDVYRDLFPKHSLDKSQFIDDLMQLKHDRDSQKVVDYWKMLDNEGKMFNILQVFESPKKQEEIKSILYSFAEFIHKDDFVYFKKMLGVHGHILEFIHAILNTPAPNYEVITYFIMVAKSPRHYDPQTIQWFWEKVIPLLDDDVVKQQFLDNCSNSIHRWIITQKRNKNFKNKFNQEMQYIKFGNNKIPGRLVPQVKKLRNL